MNYSVLPITLRAAQTFVTEHHRHNKAPRGHRASIGIGRDGVLVGDSWDCPSRPRAKSDEVITRVVWEKLT